MSSPISAVWRRAPASRRRRRNKAEGTETKMTYNKIQVNRISGALGAEITGVDLSADLDNETFDDIHRAFLDHQVIFFRDQHLTHEQHKAFGRRFGTLNIHPYVKGMDGHPEIMQIVKEPDDKVNF